MLSNKKLHPSVTAFVLTLVLVCQPFFGVSAEPAGTWLKTAPTNGATGVSTTPTLDWEDVSHTGDYYVCVDHIINNSCDFGWFMTADSNEDFSGLAGSTVYEWQVYTYIEGSQTFTDDGAWWTFTTEATLGDSYEEDDTELAAKPITSGAVQTHSIHQLYDHDWVTFHLDEPSGITLETDGPTNSDTAIVLYNSSIQQLEADDDGGQGMYSFIDRTCGVDGLRAGDYYAMVVAFADAYIIPEYTLSFTATPCEVSFLPLVVKPYIAPPGAFGKVSPSNESGSVSINPLLDWQDASGATAYQYCYDTGTTGPCSGTWYDAGTASQATPVDTLLNNTTYRWQVRASNDGGVSTYADSDTMWTFTTESWTTLMSEGFEGTWLPPASPGMDTSTTAATWQVYDMNGPTGGLYMPASRNCNQYNGSYSLWMIGGGFDGRGLGCVANYPSNAEARAVYGPFSTLGVTNLNLDYAYYAYAIVPDTLCVGLGSDINSPSSYTCYSTTSFPFWQTDSLHLDSSNYDVVNQPSVYLVIQFYSDGSGYTTAGGYVDDISIVTCNAGDIACGSTASPGLSAVQDFLSPFTSIIKSPSGRNIKIR